MKITHVLRAEEHLSNTLRQVLVLEAFECPPPLYAHCSLILGSDRAKLSKRHGSSSVSQFAADGFLPSALINYLANLGWNDGTDKEIYSAAELCDAFSMSRIVKGSAVFDMAKLRWVNSQHIKALPPDEFKTIVASQLTMGETPLLPIEAANSPLMASLAQILAATMKDKIEVLIDIPIMVVDILNYNLKAAMEIPDAEALVSNPDFTKLAAALVRDFEAGKLPFGDAPDFGK